MPEFGAPVGHHRDSVVVPMFPRYFQHMMFTDSRSLGYDYDNFDYGKHHRRDPESYLGKFAILADISCCDTTGLTY